jgi:hypothetical protein
MFNIGFFVRHFTERGTEVAIYDYAKYNEELLNNKSIIICFTEQKQKQINFPQQRFSYDKFNKRFKIIEINDISEMKRVINEYNLHFFHTLTYGGVNDIYRFNDKNIWGNCKTIMHCVFETTRFDGDFYVAIHDVLNIKYNTKFKVIPHIVNALPSENEDLRSILNIPKDAIVFGRHGGVDEFNINYVHETIANFLNMNNHNSFFLFMNTRPFYKHPRIIYLDKNLDLNYKTKFINTCDVMIHARSMGETFSLSIAEFSIKNKPVITCPIGDLAHIYELKDKAILYNSKDELMHIFKNIKPIITSKTDWSAYTLYTPEYVMNLFKTYIFH